MLTHPGPPFFEKKRKEINMTKKTKKPSEEKPEVLQDEKNERKNLAVKLDKGIKRINRKLNDLDTSIGLAIFILSTVIAWGAAAIAKGGAGFRSPAFRSD